MKTLTIQQLILDGRDWLLDIFPDNQNEIDDLEDTKVLECINLYFDGGMDAFLNTY